MSILHDIFEKQLNFQKKVNSGVEYDLDSDTRNRLYKEHCLFAVEEIVEGLRNINRKPWKQSKDTDNIDELKDELIDEFRFFINRCVLMGMGPDELIERFIRSLDKTNNRLKNNY